MGVTLYLKLTPESCPKTDTRVGASYTPNRDQTANDAVNYLNIYLNGQVKDVACKNPFTWTTSLDGEKITCKNFINAVLQKLKNDKVDKNIITHVNLFLTQKLIDPNFCDKGYINEEKLVKTMQ
jgi:hypothetical protein